MHNNLGIGRKEDKEIEKAGDDQIVELKKQIQNYEKELGRLKYIWYGLIVLLIKWCLEGCFSELGNLVVF